MSNFSFDDLQKKDLLTALGLWLVVEAVSFVLFPTLGLINPGARLRTWFLLSLPFGLGGAALVSMSSQFVAQVGDQPRKKLSSLIGQFGGWIGLAGIMFPFFVVCLEFFSTLDLPR
ncbi:hypothetical protein H6F51_19045 [Cyanobacteria bacterium FACHB-DQ100]|uniref:hypothetical protein n=1 Tax=Leptolyngbya sp. DQ-M1 TaxID=2933920 RepID=UPI0019B5B5A5|nr:hypothetical protein [Cyanobacteria bacterium FACHB-DQ100]